MKKLLLPAVLALAGLFTMSANAQTTITDPFVVTVNLTSVCTLTSPADFAISYTSFQVAAAEATSGFTVQCTNSLPYTMTLSGNADALGLTIPLTIRNAGNTADVSGAQAGTGAVISYNLRAYAAGGQAGTCATAGCSTTVSRNLVIVY